MQDRYVGDVGDYGKYGLLRVLAQATGPNPLRLGVVWCLVPGEIHNQDGKHVSYLRDERRFRKCDPELFESLRSMIGDPAGTRRESKRAVAAIESSSILPANTIFYNAALEYTCAQSLQTRPGVREGWLRAALDCTAKAEIVFIDPDNGIECSSIRQRSLRGPKFAFGDDIARFAAPARGQSLVIYHHTNRRKASSSNMDSSYEQLLQLQGEFRKRYPGSSISALIYTRGTRRAFFVVANGSHRTILDDRIIHLFETPWREHFIRVT